MAKKKRALPVLNGLSIDSMTISQDGELKVLFDLPVEQTSYAYQQELQAVRTFDVYEHPELQELCRDLFRAVRERTLEPDPELEEVNCDACKSSDCCRKYNVLVTEDDIERLSQRFGVSKKAFQKKYATDAVDWCEDYHHQLRCDEDEDGEKCVFLKRSPQGQMRCSVYEDRPQICRDYDMRTCNDFVPMEKVEMLRKSS